MREILEMSDAMFVRHCRRGLRLFETTVDPILEIQHVWLPLHYIENITLLIRPLFIRLKG